MNFNPLPLYRGRPTFDYRGFFLVRISIHSLYTEGDIHTLVATFVTVISIHSLYTEGDPLAMKPIKFIGEFQSTPSIQRETTVTLDQLNELEFQSTPSIQRETFAIIHWAITSDRFQSTPSIQRETARCSCFTSHITTYCNLFSIFVKYAS